ncbi:hypothetical protein KA005_00580 [bacterium]|nr:hypothetical protein [bacterium]
MGKSLRTIVVMLSLILIVAGVGCVALSRKVTPADVDAKAVAYVVKSGLADANDFKAWYPNVAMAGKLKKAVDDAHGINIQELQQEMEREDLKYSTHKDVVTNNYKLGQKREELLFGEKGLLSLGLSMAGIGTLTGFVGLMRKRPGDVTSQELEQVVAQSQGKTAVDLSEKEKQFVEVVKGVQKFMDTYKEKSPDVVDGMKKLFNMVQDTSTQVAIAKVKKETMV